MSKQQNGERCAVSGDNVTNTRKVIFIVDLFKRIHFVSSPSNRGCKIIFDLLT